MQDKLCVVTGANAGIGKATAVALARAGAQVILFCRDAGRGEAARHEIMVVTGSHLVDLLLIDLSSLQSVRQAAETFKQRYNHLDVLLNSAAIYKNQRVLTVDGYETMFATNHLGPFLLTALLLDSLKASPDARIINVTAPSTSSVDFDNLQGERKFSSLNAFGASKMCNLLFTYELARRLAGTTVTANAAHPGLVKSGLMREAALPIRWLTNLLSSRPEKAADAFVYLAASPELKGVSGRFLKDKKFIDSNAYSHDPAVQKQLWDVSTQLTGLV